jgi:hypothetical protein
MAVLPGAKIHLSHCGQARVFEHVDKYPELHSLSTQKRDVAQQLAVHGELAC